MPTANSNYDENSQEEATNNIKTRNLQLYLTRPQRIWPGERKIIEKLALSAPPSTEQLVCTMEKLLIRD